MDAALGNIKDLMHTRDVGALIHPFWIINFPAEAIDKKTGCGVVFGEWYEYNYSYRGKWEPIMEGNMPKYADTYTYMYGNAVKDGSFRTVSGFEEKSKSLNKICKLQLDSRYF